MAWRTLRMLCAGGDETLAEWDTETVTPEQLAEIEHEFHKKIEQGASRRIFLTNATS